MSGGQRFNYRATLAYSGAPFYGFARQPGLVTVESVLLDALRPLIPELAGISVGGRTDRGVHATGQVISFWSKVPLCKDAIAHAINTQQPKDLHVTEVASVTRSFHARFSARARQYTYFYPDCDHINIERLNRMLCTLLGKHCFSAFARDTAKNRSTERQLQRAEARRVVDGEQALLRFDFSADGFLRRQVRVLVATALSVAKSAAHEDRLLRIAKSQDRNQTEAPAAPGGLYLTRIAYDPVVSKTSRRDG